MSASKWDVGVSEKNTRGASNRRWWYLSPLLFAPLIPMTRIALRNQ